VAPATLEGEWLAIGPGRANEDYSSSRYLATYRDVRSLRAFVDLERQAVVGISPRPPASLVGEQRFLDPKPLPPCDYD
jgi:hypothetical protein